MLHCCPQIMCDRNTVRSQTKSNQRNKAWKCPLYISTVKLLQEVEFSDTKFFASSLIKVKQTLSCIKATFKQEHYRMTDMLPCPFQLIVLIVLPGVYQEALCGRACVSLGLCAQPTQ